MLSAWLLLLVVGMRDETKVLPDRVTWGVRYRLLGIGTQTEPTNEAKRQQRNAQKKFERMRLRTEMRANVNRNLPRNVPY